MNVAIAALTFGEVRWHRTTSRAVAKLTSRSCELERNAGRHAAARFSPDVCYDVPETVARYFRYALEPGTQRRTAEVTAASLVRYLAECAWLPSALLPSDRLRWRATGARTARATLHSDATSVWLDVTFGARGKSKPVETLRYRNYAGASP